jgi:hypothetical protein
VCDRMRAFFSLRAGNLLRGKFCCQRARTASPASRR